MRHATYQNKLVMRTTFVMTKKHKNSAYKHDIISYLRKIESSVNCLITTFWFLWVRAHRLFKRNVLESCSLLESPFT